jgi:O-antigen ligase
MLMLLQDGIDICSKAVRVCLLVAIFILPLNNLDALPRIFGEFSVEGAFYAVALGAIFWIISILLGDRTKWPGHISFKLLLFLVLWSIVSAIINAPDIFCAYTKGRTGLEKFFLQFIVLMFGFMTSIIVYNMALKSWKGKTFDIVQRAVFLSFIFAGIYSLIEIAYLFNSLWAESVLFKINNLFRSRLILYPGRLRSLCGEASWFGSYFSFVYPWILNCFFNSKRYFFFYVVVTGYALFMVYLSFSRTSYIIFVIETLLFILLMIRQNSLLRLKKRLLVFVCIIIGLVCIVRFIHLPIRGTEVIQSLYLKNTSYELSNVGRLGSTVAGLRMGLDHPVAGVGLGQYGFFMPKYIRPWAWKSEEIQRWADKTPSTAWAPVQNIHIRIFAELGIVGLLLWLGIWGTPCFSVYKTGAISASENHEFGIVLITSLFGSMLSGFNLDSFRFMPYWFLLALIWLWLELSESAEKETG